MREFLLSNTISVLERLLKFFRPVDPKDLQIAALEKRNEFLRATLANEVPDFDAIRVDANPDNDPLVNTLLDTMRRDVQMRVGAHTTMHNQASANVKLLAPIVAKTFQKLAMRCLVGVQPMSSPVSQIHVLRVTKPEDKPNIRFSIQILKEVVEARTRKLNTRWTAEPVVPVDADPPDVAERIEDAFNDVISGACADEIDQELYTAVLEQATRYDPVVTIDQLVSVVSRLAEDIASTARRGRGNVMIMSHAVYRTLATHQLLAFRADTIASGGNSMIQPVGWLTTTVPGGETTDIRVYANFATDLDDGTVLIGYKGFDEMDAGYFYCPYSIVTATGVVIDPHEFMPVMNLITRYGATPNGDVAANYYRAFTVQLPDEA